MTDHHTRAGWSLSIDLGTSNTVAAVRSGGAVPQPRPTVPSSVYLDGVSTYVGEAAADHAADDPSAFHPSPKRELMDSPGRHRELVPVLAALYRDIFLNAVGQFGPDMPSAVVLTHPEALSDGGVDALVQAAVEADIPRSLIRTVSEPVAAAGWYGRFADNPARLLVVDVGGGTTDVALLRFSDSGQALTVTRTGDNGLGGRSFDHRVIQAAAARLDGGKPDPDTLAFLGGSLRYRRFRDARELLSNQDSVSVSLEDSATDTGNCPNSVEFTRTELEALTAGDRQRIRTLIERALREEKDNVTGVLTGGLALMPALQQDVASLVTLKPVDDPFAAVARGALLVDGTGEPETAVEHQPEPPPDAQKRRVLLPVLALLVTAVLALVFVVILQRDDNGDFGEADTGAADAGHTAQGSTFDSSPVMPVILEDSSILRDPTNPDTLTCGALAEALYRELSSDGSTPLEQPSARGLNGNTTCELSPRGSSHSLSVSTYTPRRFELFNTARSPQAQLSITKPLDDLSAWYRVTDVGGTRASESSFLYADGLGWLEVTVSGEKAVDSPLSDMLVRIIDPLTGTVQDS